jgi:hypothetical protein
LALVLGIQVDDASDGLADAQDDLETGQSSATAVQGSAAPG